MAVRGKVFRRTSRYLGDDLTIILFANLAGADTKRFVQGIGALFNPRIAPTELGPIADREPAVTARLRNLLSAAAQGKLSPNDFAYVRVGFFSGAVTRYERFLQPLGEVQKLELLERRELGDDRIYTYQALFGNRTLIAQLGLAPDDKVSQFSVRPK